MGLDRRRLTRIAFSAPSVAVITASGASVCAIIGVVGAVPSGLRLTDTSGVTGTAWTVFALTVGALVTVTIAALLDVQTPRWWRRPIPEIAATVVLVLALAIGVAPLRSAIDRSFEAVRGPVGSTTLPFTVAAVALSATAIAVAALVSVANSHRRVHPSSSARVPSTVVVASVVVVAITVALAAPPATHHVAVEHFDAATSPAVGDPAVAVAGARTVVWRAPTADVETEGGQVILADDRAVVARDIRTGARLWSVPRESLYRRSGTAGPSGVRVITDRTDGADVVVVRDGSRLTGLDASTGDILWWSDATTGIIGADTGTTVLVVYARAPVDASDARRPVTLTGVDSRSGRERWSIPVGVGDRCSADGAVVGGHAVYTDCDSRTHTVELATGHTTAIAGLPRVQPTVFAAGTRIGLRTLESTVSRTRLLEPGVSRAIDPPLDRRVLSPVVGNDVLVDGAGAVVVHDLETGRDRALPLGSLPGDVAGLTWSSVGGDTLVGGAQRLSPGFDPVVASVDLDSGAVSTISSPCRWGIPVSADAVGDRLLVVCREDSTSSRRSEVVVLGPVNS